MTLDYKRILKDMNRPERRQGISMKTILTAVVLMTAIAVGTFSAFKYGVVDKAKNNAVELAGKLIGGNDDNNGETPPEQAAFTPPVPTQGAGVVGIPQNIATAPAAPIAAPVAAARIQPEPVRPAGLRPPSSAAPATVQSLPVYQPQAQPAGSFIPAAVTMAQATLPKNDPISDMSAMAPPARMTPVPAMDQAVNQIEGNDSPAVVSVADVAVSEAARQSSLRPSSNNRAQAQMQMQAIGQQRAQAAQQQAQVLAESQAARRQTAVNGSMPSATPVLSEAKERIKAIDQLLGSNPAEALRRIEELQSTPLAPDDAAETGYRRGYVARLLQDETTAESAWKEAADKYPTLRGGRFSALALGDTWYHKYAGTRPQVSYWDDIQLMYSKALGTDDAPFLPEEVKRQVKEKLKRLNDSLFFGGSPTKLGRYHKVEPGELLSGIANKYRVDYESIARVNGIDPNRIRAGMDLKLVVGDVDVIVRKYGNDPSKQPTLTWYLDGRWIREYPCCVGDGNKTPAGTYTLTSKERFPSWTNPVNGQLLSNDHPENILGSRWMAMKGMSTQGLGIHGTTVDDSIPGYTSAGCVRLLNKDVEELFSFGRIGGRVTVIE